MTVMDIIYGERNNITHIHTYTHTQIYNNNWIKLDAISNLKNIYIYWAGINIHNSDNQKSEWNKSKSVKEMWRVDM